MRAHRLSPSRPGRITTLANASRQRQTVSVRARCRLTFPVVARRRPSSCRCARTRGAPAALLGACNGLHEVEFHLGHGDWFNLLRDSGFELLDLIELYAAEDAVDHPFYSYVPAAWAKQWPAEEIWRARKR